MAIIFACTGGLLGFVAAVVSLATGQPVMVALALWSGAGIGFAALGLALALLPRRAPARARQAA